MKRKISKERAERDKQIIRDIIEKARLKSEAKRGHPLNILRIVQEACPHQKFYSVILGDGKLHPEWDE